MAEQSWQYITVLAVLRVCRKIKRIPAFILSDSLDQSVSGLFESLQRCAIHQWRHCWDCRASGYYEWWVALSALEIRLLPAFKVGEWQESINRSIYTLRTANTAMGFIQLLHGFLYSSFLLIVLYSNRFAKINLSAIYFELGVCMQLHEKRLTLYNPNFDTYFTRFGVK